MSVSVGVDAHACPDLVAEQTCMQEGEYLAFADTRAAGMQTDTHGLVACRHLHACL